MPWQKKAELIRRVVARYRQGQEKDPYEEPRVPNPQSKNVPREMDLATSSREEWVTYQKMFPGTEREVADVEEAREQKNRRRRKNTLTREDATRRRRRRRPRPSQGRDA